MTGNPVSTGASGPEESTVVTLGELKRLDLRPGDVLILQVPADLSCEQAGRLRQEFAKAVPGHQIGILTGGATVAAIGREQLDDTLTGLNITRCTCEVVSGGAVVSRPDCRLHCAAPDNSPAAVLDRYRRGE